jgi:ribose transport system substrate-binding protein
VPSFPATRSLGRSCLPGGRPPVPPEGAPDGKPRHRIGRATVVAALATAALGLAACSSSGSSSSAPPATSSSSAPASSSASAAPKAMNIAYLSFAVDNTYDAPMLAAAQAVASTDGATLKVFDANNNPQTQFDQLQTVISSGQYNGIITQPIVSTGLVTLVQQAIAKGMKVVNMDQILGTSLSTDAPQVTGLSANVTFVPTTIGTQLGQQVVAACASKNLNPCKVGYLYDIKASSLDTAIFGGFSAAIKGSPVQVVANGQSFFTPTDGESATQTMLQAQPGLNVITGSDQGMEGATVALSTAHKTGQVLLVGYGASDAAIAGVASGAWFSDVAQAPASEGRLAVQALVAAIQTGKVSGAINPVAAEPNGGIVTKATASQFTGEWTG